MTEAQLLTALKALLVAQTWSGGTVVFPTGCVAITADVDLAMESALKTMRTPFCLLQPLDTTADPEFDEDPNLAQLGVKTRFVVMVPGDAIGENALMGANKTGGATASEGRGLYEVEQMAFTAIGRVNGLEGIILQCRHKGGIRSAIVENNIYVAYRDLTFEAMGTMV